MEITFVYRVSIHVTLLILWGRKDEAPPWVPPSDDFRWVQMTWGDFRSPRDVLAPQPKRRHTKSGQVSEVSSKTRKPNTVSVFRYSAHCALSLVSHSAWEIYRSIGGPLITRLVLRELIDSHTFSHSYCELKIFIIRCLDGHTPFLKHFSINSMKESMKNLIVRGSTCKNGNYLCQ